MNLINQSYNENKQKYILKLHSALNQFRERAEKAGLTEEDVQELIEIINVLVDAKPKVNLKNGDLVYLVITVDNRKPADNEQYLLYRQPEEGIAKAKFLDIDELRELVISANN